MNNNVIKKCISSLEEIYSLNSIIEGYKLSDLGITEFISRLKIIINDKSSEEIKSINISASKSISAISYIDGRLRFSESVVLDFTKFPSLLNLVNMCSDFLEKKSINSKSLTKVNKTLKSLSLMDETSDNFKLTLSYRIARILIVMILFSNYGDSSILCSFIMNQIYLKEKEDALRESKEFVL